MHGFERFFIKTGWYNFKNCCLRLNFKIRIKTAVGCPRVFDYHTRAGSGFKKVLALGGSSTRVFKKLVPSLQINTVHCWTESETCKETRAVNSSKAWSAAQHRVRVRVDEKLVFSSVADCWEVKVQAWLRRDLIYKMSVLLRRLCSVTWLPFPQNDLWKINQMAAIMENNAAQNQEVSASSGWDSWIPTSVRSKMTAIDDFWDLVEQLKANFSHGIFKGLEETFQQVAVWVMSWQIWKSATIQGWIRYFITMSKYFTF